MVMRGEQMFGLHFPRGWGGCTCLFVHFFMGGGKCPVGGRGGEHMSWNQIF